MKVIVVGLGKIGTEILHFMSEESHNIVAIDIDETKVEQIQEKFDVIGVAGNGCTVDVLTEAGVETADLILAVTQSDEQNILCCTIAKSLGAKNTIARVSSPEYNKQADFMRSKFGIDRFVNPEKSFAEAITRILRFPSAEKVYTFAKGKVEMVEMKLIQSELVGKKLSELKMTEKRYSVLISAIERSGTVIIPNGETVLEDGDIVSICGKHTEICEFLRNYGLLKKKVGYVMILGADRKAYYLASDLIKYGFSVKIISPNLKKCEVMQDLISEVPVICGDFTDKELLESEGIEDADAVVAMSDYDENNVMISLFARHKHVPKTVTMIRTGTYLSILNEFDLDTLISPYRVVADDMVKYLRSISVPADSRIVALYSIANEKAEAIQFDINENPEFSSVAIKDLSKKLKSGILITAIIRKNVLVVPNGDTVIEPNDSVIVISGIDEPISSVEDILR